MVKARDFSMLIHSCLAFVRLNKDSRGGGTTHKIRKQGDELTHTPGLLPPSLTVVKEKN